MSTSELKSLMAKTSANLYFSVKFANKKNFKKVYLIFFCGGSTGAGHRLVQFSMDLFQKQGGGLYNRRSLLVWVIWSITIKKHLDRDWPNDLHVRQWEFYTGLPHQGAEVSYWNKSMLVSQFSGTLNYYKVTVEKHGSLKETHLWQTWPWWWQTCKID